MKVLDGPLRKGAVAGVALTVGAGLVLTLLPLPTAFRGVAISLIELAVALGAFSLSVYAWGKTTGVDRRTWLLLSCSMGAFSLGVMWRVASLASRGVEPHSPSVADLGYLVGILALVPVVAAIGSPGDVSLIRRIVSGIDLAALVVITLTLTYGLLLRSIGVVGPQSGVPRSALLGTYATLSIALALYSWVFRREPWVPWAVLVAASVGSGSLSALGTIVTLGYGSTLVGTRVAALWSLLLVVSFALVGLGAVWRVTMKPHKSAPAPIESLPMWAGTVVCGLSAVAIPMTIGYALVLSDAWASTVLGTAASILGVLLAFRLFAVLVQIHGSGSTIEVARRYRVLVEHSPVSVLVVAGDGRVLFANPAMARVMRTASPYDLIGSDFMQMLPTRGAMLREQAELESLLAQLQEKPSHVRDVPVRSMQLVAMSGQVVTVERTVVAIVYDSVPAVLFQMQEVGPLGGPDVVEAAREVRAASRLRGHTP